MTLFTIDNIIIGLLGVICTLLSYWAIRLENRITLILTGLIDIRERIPKEYVHKEEFKERIEEICESIIHKKWGQVSHTPVPPVLYKILEKASLNNNQS